MLPEIGASELLVIAIVALIVVGPKDLPLLLRKLGQFMARIRGMAAEFRASFDEMARQSELDELRKEVEAMRRGQLDDIAALEAGKVDVEQAFAEIDRSMAAGDVQALPPMGDQWPNDGMPPAEPIADAAPAPAAPKPARKRAPAKPKADAAAAPRKPRARRTDGQA